MILPTGIARLTRLIFQRDRWLMPLWVVLPPLMLLAFATALADSFPTPQLREQYVHSSGPNAMFIVMYGNLHGAGLGQLVAWRAGFFPVVIGLCSLLTVIRHTRTEEESGRTELIAATPISRHAGLAAALAVTCAANLLLGLLTALMLTVWGLPVAGSVALGSGLVIAGWSFAAIGAVTAQLTASASVARGIGIATLGGAFLLRGLGDISGHAGGGFAWVAWLSPVSWVEQLHAYAGERWWVLLVAAGVVAGLVALAVNLATRHDLGAGLLQPRSGPGMAAPSLRAPVALAWRLHRGSLASWTVGAALTGLAFGGIGTAGEQISTTMSPETQQILDGLLSGSGSLQDQFIAVVLEMFSMVAAGYALLTVLALLAEERGGRAEALLATPVNRTRWANSHLLFAMLNPAIITAVFGAAVGLVHGISTGDLSEQLPRILGAALVRLPVIWWFAGLAFALFAIRPKIANAAFVVLAGSLLILGLGIQLHLGPWILNLSPFAHVPELPGGELHLPPLLALMLFTAGLTAIGVEFLRRRDLPAA